MSTETLSHYKQYKEISDICHKRWVENNREKHLNYNLDYYYRNRDVINAKRREKRRKEKIEKEKLKNNS